MAQALTAIFKVHITKYTSHVEVPTKSKKAKHSVTKKKICFSAAHVNVAKKGLLKLQKALGRAIHPEAITSSFATTGLFPYNFHRS